MLPCPQFVSDESNRACLRKRNNDHQWRNKDLTHKEVQRILDREPGQTTAVLRWRRGISASGESSQFFGGVIEFRSAHYVTFSELFWWARQHATALNMCGSSTFLCSRPMRPK